MQRINGTRGSEDKDWLAVEEPLELQVEGHSVAVVMRTPGNDRELAAGFVVTEGVVQSAHDVVEIAHRPHCLSSLLTGHPGPHTTPASSRLAEAVAGPDLLPQGSGNTQLGPDMSPSGGNVVNVRLRHPERLDLKRLSRHVFSSSSCGICSKASIKVVRQQFPPIKDDFEIEPEVLIGLPAALASAQDTFKRTGGLHACALFDAAGNLLVLREDVGRHNALDKVIGWALLEGRLPLRRHLLLLSGRTSFEMMQKALAGGIPVIAAISAPSSLAVEFARESGQTLVGFLRGERMNIYAGAGRLAHSRQARCPSPVAGRKARLASKVLEGTGPIPSIPQ